MKPKTNRQQPIEVLQKKALAAYCAEHADLLVEPISPQSDWSVLTACKIELERWLEGTILEQLETPYPLNHSDLPALLSLPHVIDIADRHVGTEKDPISGNLRPRVKRYRLRVPVADELIELRKAFERALAMLTLHAKRIGSPVYPDLRKLYFGRRNLDRQCGRDAIEREDESKILQETLLELMAELQLDTEIENVQKTEVRRG